MDMSISIADQRAILRGKIKFHKREYFGYQAEAQAARDVGNLDQMVEAAVKGMAATLKVVAAFQEQLDALKEDEA